MNVTSLKNDLEILNLENCTGRYKKRTEKLSIVIPFTDGRLEWRRWIRSADRVGKQSCCLWQKKERTI